MKNEYPYLVCPECFHANLGDRELWKYRFSEAGYDDDSYWMDEEEGTCPACGKTSEWDYIEAAAKRTLCAILYLLWPQPLFVELIFRTNFPPEWGEPCTATMGPIPMIGDTPVKYITIPAYHIREAMNLIGKNLNDLIGIVGRSAK